jgi:hypothetical protein
MLNSKLICDLCNSLKFVPTSEHSRNENLKCPNCGNTFVYHKNIRLKQTLYPKLSKHNKFIQGTE